MKLTRRFLRDRFLRKHGLPIAMGMMLACLPVMMLGQSDMNNMGKQSANNLSATDKKFVRDAAQGGLAEVELGKLATEKASNEDVKKFGQRMVDDHSKANDELKQIASSQGITLPDHLNAQDRALKDRLSKLSGAEFDRVYMQSMVKDHKADIAEFQHESNSGTDTAVKNFASNTLPTLQSHLQEAEKVAPETRASAKASSPGMQR
jgi:putative membrane protein